VNEADRRLEMRFVKGKDIDTTPNDVLEHLRTVGEAEVKLLERTEVLIEGSQRRSNFLRT